ncbi:hypothetical protein [Ostreibacterium oceani]|uniref:Uncharacterized protein n=1 Tax=Ostreibacterium oceani TaxID=2654998 RepID=A0A6N7F0T8_9GAMM|nr:hypothetical protein [Ostreibacterium oceani]MPV85466.1 hypothetical protein [Ostreibacterium oceani]
MKIKDFLYRHVVIAFVLLVLAGLSFGALTVNLFQLVSANWAFISAHGWLALKLGALAQLFELLFLGLLAMGCFVVFKLCEGAVTARLGDMKLPSFRRSQSRSQPHSRPHSRSNKDKR